MTRKRQKTIVALTLAGVAALVTAGTRAVDAQTRLRQREPVVTLQAALAPTAVKRGGQATLTLSLAIRDGYHINAVKPGNPDLIAASLDVTPPAGIKPGTPRYPASQTLTLPGMTAGSQVYEGKQTVTVPLLIGKTAKPGTQAVAVKFGYQACNATSCLPPDSARAQVSLTVR